MMLKRSLLFLLILSLAACGQAGQETTAEVPVTGAGTPTTPLLTITADPLQAPTSPGITAATPIPLTTGTALEGMEIPIPTSKPSRITTSEAEVDPTEAAMFANTQAASAATALPLACTAPAGLTPALTEGPYFSAGSPEQTDLTGNGAVPGVRLVLSGRVLDSDCQPVPGAKLDFWQADSQGVYDNEGYTLRGHQFTNENGEYHLITVVPGFYSGRTEHIHLKVQAPGGPELTSQLFFPDTAENETDRIFDESLIINVTSQTESEIQATFDFIVER